MIKFYFCFILRPFLVCLAAVILGAGTLNAQSDYPIGSGTSGNGETAYPAPLQDWYEGSRMQYLFLASELNAAGITAGSFNAIKYQVLTLATSTNSFFEVEQMQIKIGTTTTASLSATSWENVTTTVYGPFNYLPVLGTNTFNFNTPFFWNGTDNIVIEICNGLPNNDMDVYYTGNAEVPWTTGLPFNASHSYRADNLGNLCGTATTTNTGLMTTRPNIIFNWTPAAPCASPPTPGTATANPSAVCGGTPVNLSVTGASIGSGQTYQWQSSPTVGGTYTSFGPVSASPFYTISAPTSTTYYRVAVTCSGNTQYSTPVELVVNASEPTPMITSNPGDTVCSGTNVMLSTPACAGCDYYWSTGETTNTINVDEAGFYSVNVANACGDATVAKEIFINPAPSMSIQATTSVCQGNSTQIEASGASTYTWSPATGLNTTTGPVVIATPTSTTTYTVTGESNGCVQAMDVTITVNAMPATPTITASGSTTFCAGGSLTLTSSASGGNQWYRNGDSISGATGTTYAVSESGSYTVRSTMNGCSSPLSSATVATVNDVPPQPTISQAGNTLNSSAPAGNQWFFNGSAIGGAINQAYTPTTSGPHTVQVTLSGCASAMSGTYAFALTGINSPDLDNKITMAPNPVRDMLNIKYNGPAARFTIMLVGVNGNILSKDSFTTTYELDMSRLQSGAYIVSIINERNGDTVRRIIIKQ